MTLQEKLVALAVTELFRTVNEAALRDLATSVLERRFAREQVLFSVGEKANGLFVIVSGSLRAYRQTRAELEKPPAPNAYDRSR
ncbi:MAG: cyclic nucleotide-binding domain-containing protein [Silvibacterium sp.]